MKKELLIIVFKINVQSLTRQQAQQQIYEFMQSNTLSSDEELKENYTIREIWLPITDGQSDVKVIYPIPQYSQNIELEELVKTISENMKKYPDSALTNDWKKLVRSLKLKKLDIELC